MNGWCITCPHLGSAGPTVRAPRTREHPSPLRVGTSMLTQCTQGVETAGRSIDGGGCHPFGGCTPMPLFAFDGLGRVLHLLRRQPCAPSLMLAYVASIRLGWAMAALPRCCPGAGGLRLHPAPIFLGVLLFDLWCWPVLWRVGPWPITMVWVGLMLRCCAISRGWARWPSRVAPWMPSGHQTRSLRLGFSWVCVWASLSVRLGCIAWRLPGLGVDPHSGWLTCAWCPPSAMRLWPTSVWLHIASGGG